MSTGARWVIGVVAAVLIVALLIWARGYQHHHGDDVGAVADMSSAPRY